MNNNKTLILCGDYKRLLNKLEFFVPVCEKKRVEKKSTSLSRINLINAMCEDYVRLVTSSLLTRTVTLQRGDLSSPPANALTFIN